MEQPYRRRQQAVWGDIAAVRRRVAPYIDEGSLSCETLPAVILSIAGPMGDSVREYSQGLPLVRKLEEALRTWRFFSSISAPR